MKKKILSLPSLFLLLSLTALLFSCGVRPIKSSPKDARVVADVGGFEVPYEQVRYLARKNREAMIASYGEGIFDGDEGETYRRELETRVEDDLLTHYTILTVGKEHGITPDTDDIRKAVQKTVEDTVKAYGSTDAYREALAADGLTDAVFRFLVGVYACESSLFTSFDAWGGLPADDTALDALLSARLYRTTHIYLPVNYGGADKEENRKKIDAMARRLAEGSATFEELQYEGGTDPSLPADGYYFLLGYADPVYENAAKDLAVGTCSDVIEARGAFYIVRRLPVPDGYVDAHREELKGTCRQILFNETLTAKKETLTVTYRESFDFAALS